MGPGKPLSPFQRSSPTLIVAAIPAHNEEKTIARVVLGAQRYADKVLVCDDGSQDLTAEIAERLGAEVIRHGRRFGYGAAVRSLFKRGRELEAEVVVTIDADGQHNPEEIPKLLTPLKGGAADVVIGSRFIEAGSSVPWYRKQGIKVITKLSGADEIRITDAQSGFRAYSTKALDTILPAEQGMGASTEILMRAVESGLRLTEVPVGARYKGLQTCSQNPLYHGLDVVASVLKFISMRHPLRFYGGIGISALSAALGFGLWAIAIYTNEGRLVTNLVVLATGLGLVGTLAVFTGLILFTLLSLLKEQI